MVCAVLFEQAPQVSLLSICIAYGQKGQPSGDRLGGQTQEDLLAEDVILEGANAAPLQDKVDDEGEL